MTKLRDKAILVHCHISQWTGSKRSQKESQELCSKKGAADDAATVIVNYVPKETLAELRTKGNRIRATFFKWTRPWLDGGIRILALANMPKYDKEMQEAIDSYNKCASRWVKEKYPTILSKMPARLAALLDNQRMPSQMELLSKFRIEHSKFPVPDADDILLSGEGGQELKKQVSQSINESAKKSMLDIWTELAGLIEKVQERLRDPDKKFKDSLIKNLKTFCERVPNENFTDDTQLENIRQTVIKKLGSIDPQDLRDNKLYRKGASLKAGEILKSIRNIDLDLE
jgi:hypothetical protein